MMTTTKTARTIDLSGASITVNEYGITRKGKDWETICRIVDSPAGARELQSGLTGGSHGTDHGYTDYEIDGRRIRVHYPGHLTSGYIEVIA